MRTVIWSHSTVRFGLIWRRRMRLSNTSRGRRWRESSAKRRSGRTLATPRRWRSSGRYRRKSGGQFGVIPLTPCRLLQASTRSIWATDISGRPAAPLLFSFPAGSRYRSRRTARAARRTPPPRTAAAYASIGTSARGLPARLRGASRSGALGSQYRARPRGSHVGVEGAGCTGTGVRKGHKRSQPTDPPKASLASAPQPRPGLLRRQSCGCQNSG